MEAMGVTNDHDASNDASDAAGNEDDAFLTSAMRQTPGLRKSSFTNKFYNIIRFYRK